jgi:hypothetical protein
MYAYTSFEILYLHERSQQNSKNSYWTRSNLDDFFFFNFESGIHSFKSMNKNTVFIFFFEKQ